MKMLAIAVQMGGASLISEKGFQAMKDFIEEKPKQIEVI